MASARIQRWALTLAAYHYDINYKSGKTNANADVLNRLPLPEYAASSRRTCSTHGRSPKFTHQGRPNKNMNQS